MTRYINLIIYCRLEYIITSFVCLFNLNNLFSKINFNLFIEKLFLTIMILLKSSISPKREPPQKKNLMFPWHEMKGIYEFLINSSKWVPRHSYSHISNSWVTFQNGTEIYIRKQLRKRKRFSRTQELVELHD